MAKHLVAIVIPVYKKDLSDFEILSLHQCVKVLNQCPFFFVVPDDIDFTNYLPFCSAIKYSLVKFDKEYFKNIDRYNRLMLSPSFYKRFLDYKFILIHQLDAFVFKDELSYWCSQNYDYIGAPNAPHKNLPDELQFLKNYDKVLSFINKIFRTDLKIKNVGNGGFSLRKTSRCYWLLTLLKPQIIKWGLNNEDGFFKYWGNLLSPFFKLPADEVALKFSIETSPKESLKKLNNELPFGCHALEKYEWETWKPLLKKQSAIIGDYK